jgi:glyoxylase-like metal-dependent hydrolase (beta-lactamase superfamily II)
MMRIRDFVKDGDTLRWGGYEARVLHTPGHTQGSISLVVDTSSIALAGKLPGTSGGSLPAARLLAGDTLFQGSIGRTDLPGGSFPQILSSIREKLLSLPDELVVYPGHGATTTIGAERAFNPFLR